jgi:hypothetical protein
MHSEAFGFVIVGVSDVLGYFNDCGLWSFGGMGLLLLTCNITVY